MDLSSGQSNIFQHCRLGVTSALFCLGLGTGIYGLRNPTEGARVFGITGSASSSKAAGHVQSGLARAFALRNVGTGVAGLALLLYLRFSQVTTSAATAAEAFRHAIGITLVAGTVVGAGDALILARFASHEDCEDHEYVKGKAYGHGITSAFIAGIGLSWFWP